MVETEEEYTKKRSYSRSRSRSESPKKARNSRSPSYVSDRSRSKSKSRSRSRSRSRHSREGSRRGGNSRGDRSGCSLLVRNLSKHTSTSELKYEFKRFGDLRDVYIPLDYNTRQPRGYAFVEFYDKRDADDALREMDRRKIDGREIAVVMARQKRKSPDEMRKVYGNGYRDRDRGRSGRDRRRYSRSRSRSRRRYRSRSYSR